MFGNVDVRDDSDTEVTAFNGGFSDSRISDVWIQNEKVGVWIVGPSSNLTLTNLRIQDTTADGINLDAYAGPITSTTIANNFLRNTQDDGIASSASPRRRTVHGRRTGCGRRRSRSRRCRSRSGVRRLGR